jgi:hypothetical protein
VPAAPVEAMHRRGQQRTDVFAHSKVYVAVGLVWVEFGSTGHIRDPPPASPPSTRLTVPLEPHGQARPGGLEPPTLGLEVQIPIWL